MTPSAPPRDLLPRLTGAALLLAAVVPMHVAYSVPPSPTVYNQVAALALWGAVVVLLSLRAAPGTRAALRAAVPLVVAIGLVGAAALMSWISGRLPGSVAMAALGVIIALAVMALSGAAARHRADGQRVLELFFAAWLASGVVTALVCGIQIFAPGWTDGAWIATTTLADGRAIGNLRQPNQASSLLLWAALAVIPLLETGRLRRGTGIGLFALLLAGVVLTASRTGILCVVGLTLWGLLDARLARTSRALLASSVVWYALFWLAMSAWASASGQLAAGAGSMSQRSLTSSRNELWLDALALIARDPWAGTGFGQFNFAWTLTPAPVRTGPFFDHAHNIALQFAAELGLPLAALVLGLLGWSLWRAWRNSVDAPPATTVSLRCAFAMVLVMAVHSQLEYPLWLAFFSLPTAWAWGHCLGQGPGAAPAGSEAGSRPVATLTVAGLAMVAGAIAALGDYARVTPIYAATSEAELAERIQAGQRSWLFSHHADYAAAVTATGPAQAQAPLARAMHVTLDDQLLVVLARTLAMQGDLERARHVAQRLREFNSARAADFIAACDAGTFQPPSFRCEPPARELDWRDFR